MKSLASSRTSLTLPAASLFHGHLVGGFAARMSNSFFSSDVKVLEPRQSMLCSPKSQINLCYCVLLFFTTEHLFYQFCFLRLHWCPWYFYSCLISASRPYVPLNIRKMCCITSTLQHFDAPGKLRNVTIEHVCHVKFILHVWDLSFISGGGGELGGGTGEKPVQDCFWTYMWGTPFIFSGSLIPKIVHGIADVLAV